MENQLFEDQELIEVDVGDDLPPEDDSTVWTETGENIDGVEDFEFREPCLDMSICKFVGHSNESVYCVEIHRTRPGVVITGGGDDKAFIWKYGPSTEGTTTIESCIELNGHHDTVTSVGFNFDGTMCLTGSYDGTVRIWEVETGKLSLLLDGPEDVEWATWHSKGNAVVAGSKDGTIWMWLTHNGQCIQVFAGHDGGVSCGCFSQDGKMVCTGGDDGSVRLWAPKTGMCKQVFEGHVGHEGTVTCMANSSDGDLLLSGSIDGKVRLYQLSGKKLLQTFVHSTPTAVPTTTATPNTDSSHNKTSSSSASSSAPAAAVAMTSDDADNFMPPPPPPSNMDMSSAGVALLSADIDDEHESEQRRMESESTLALECLGFCNYCEGAAASSVPGRSRWMASGGMDSNLKIWDIVTGACRGVCVHPVSVVAMKWHASLPLIATAALDGVVRLWDARTCAMVLELTGHNDLITNLDMVPIPPGYFAGSEGAATDVIVTVSDDCTARIFHINAPALLS